MNALIADVAVAGVPEPVPVVLEPQEVVRALRRRTEEDVPVQTGRRRLIVGVPDRRTALEAQPLGIVDLPDSAIPQQFDGAPLVPDAAALHPDLYHAIVLAGRFHHLLPFEYV